MPSFKKKISLFIFVVATLLVVGLLPLLLTGWILSNKSGQELRASENRYQIQLVQDKARQFEMFGKRFTSIVSGFGTAFEMQNDPQILTSAETETKLAQALKENPDLLAFSITQEGAEPLSVFRPGGLRRDEIEQLAGAAASASNATGVSVGTPQRIDNSDQFVMTFSRRSRVKSGEMVNLVAIASLQGISQTLVGSTKANEAELMKAGLPIVFVTDANGRSVFHPDPNLVSNSTPLTYLRIVTEWIESGQQVQSALVPFSADNEGTVHAMIGAYSTAVVGSNAYGVMTIQDERTALASVGEMRFQIWLISVAFALLAVIVGLVGSRFLTSPLKRLVNASQKIAAGDFSSRVETNNISELGVLGDSFNSMTDKVEEQIVKLAKAATENRELFVGTVKALAAAIDGKDKYTRGHSERVARISVAIGRRMGMTDAELDDLRMGALLHDVGKIAIDDAILKKPAALTDAEYEIMKTHPQRGYKIMSQIPAMKDFLPAMYMHHEMVNGQGYPQGLKGDEIPLQAKIVSVADTFDAMTIDRPYQKGMELAPALERLRSFVGTRYQSEVVEALIDACNAGEVANGIVRQLAERRAALTLVEPVEPEEEEDDDLLELAVA
ncbi:MAG: HD domain-containing protein [Blastocatellia bacterium]|nr:HD domain-containing protein [Blastocatellia bacterium]